MQQLPSLPGGQRLSFSLFSFIATTPWICRGFPAPAVLAAPASKPGSEGCKINVTMGQDKHWLFLEQNTNQTKTKGYICM